MNRPGRTVYPVTVDPSLARGVSGCGLLATVLVVGLTAWAAGLPYQLITALAAALALLALPTLLRGTARAAVSVDGDHLTEWYPLGLRRSVRLDSLDRVDIDDHGAVAYAHGRRIVLAPPLCDWLRAAYQCRRAIGGEVPSDVASEDELGLPAEEVAHWLGIGVDDTLTLPCAFHKKAYPVIQVVLIAGGLVSGVGGLPSLMAALALALACQPARSGGRRVHEVQARATELDILTDQGWRRVGWGALASLKQRGLFWVVDTPHGEIWLPPGLPQLERLLRAMKSAIDARRSGWTLPRMTADVSAAAISLVGPREAEIERGLSAAEE